MIGLSWIEAVILAFLAGVCTGFTGLALYMHHITRDYYDAWEEENDDGT